jgi:hypothetical protein
MTETAEAGILIGLEGRGKTGLSYRFGHLHVDVHVLVLLSGTPHTVKYAARKHRVPGALGPAAGAPALHGVRPPSGAPPATAPVFGHAQKPARQSADALPLADPSRPGQRRTRHLFNRLSEEKAIRSLRIDRVTEKNQKKWKLLIEKTGC